MREEAERLAAEEAAMNAPTEKDMINDIRENRRRERRQVSLFLVKNIQHKIHYTHTTFFTGTSTSKYFQN